MCHQRKVTIVFIYCSVLIIIFKCCSNSNMTTGLLALGWMDCL